MVELKPKNPRYNVRRSRLIEIGSTRQHWNRAHITGLRGFDFEWSLGYKTATCKMGAAFAKIWPYFQSCETSKESLALFNHKADKFLRLLITVDERWIDHNKSESKQQSTMSFSGQNGAGKHQKEFNPHQLVSKEKQNQGRIICHPIEPV